MPLTYSNLFHVLTQTSLYAFQFVSALTCLLSLILYFNLYLAHSSLCASLTFFILLKQTYLYLLCLPECKLLSYICSLYVLILSFSALQALFSKLSLFCDNVLFLFYNPIFILLIYFQPPLLVSSDDYIHHKLIGIFLLSISAISNIKNRDSSHS